jgi:uncharacterized protein (DUF58 family)
MSEDTRDLIRAIRRVELITRQRVAGQQTGVHISLFKGQGVEFSEIREYMPGDDIRAIDWKVTARYGKPYIKEFTEERDQTFYFVFDLSGSGKFGMVQSKYKTMLEILASLVFSALMYHDRVGLLLVTDRVEAFIPARGGRKHGIALLQKVVEHKAGSERSDLRPALTHLARSLRRSSSVILLSDFFIPDCDRELSILKLHHEVMAIQVVDPRERDIPDVGLIELEDAETGEQILIDTSDEVFRARYQEVVAEADTRTEHMFRRHNIPSVQISAGDDWQGRLNRLFSKVPSMGVF